jgi:cytochrome c-type biogenesis protein CcmH/NrfG
VPSGTVKAAAPKPRTAGADSTRAPSTQRGASATTAPKTVDYGRGPSTRSSAAFHERLARPDATDSALAQESVRHVRAQKPALEAGIASLREIAAKDPQAARKIAKAGSAAARAQGIAAGIGVGAVLGPAAREGVTKCFWDPPLYNECPGSYWYPWGAGLAWYGNNFCFNGGFGSNNWYWYWPNGGFACFGPSLSFCWNFGWNASLYWSSWYWHKPWYSYGCPAVVYSTCYVPYYAPSYVSSYVSSVPSYYPEAVEPQPDAYAVAAAAEAVPAGESSYAGAPRADQPAAASAESINSAATRFLELGDAAFRAQRYSDAVQHYARAVENAPDAGVLYLVLADALFATRDYHYAAYALRRALILEPALASGAIDKHGFYTDPTEFDRQLAVLELYVKDNPLDADARLVLAANYLYGARPQAAVELLEAPGASALGVDSAAALILQAARGAQYGPPSSAPAALPLLLEQGKS